ncbi:MAG: DNA-binding protein [Methylococcaceae bacterium]|nr:DNA-binding protein [Methylococcaceae bacterium]MDP2395036.1 DNA-binding protein [Methylococcaceae bacterium]MDP3020536.1 DNA-binding protein [Methylococcaceae bacterium]MDP3389727.1 DNA-binding protein [Methylococcaceae bacterium]MDP3932524.1 DNA-binding protein [Methylococcaceae bacterium]
MTPEQRKKKFIDNGECPGQWADNNQFPRDVVYKLLNKRLTGSRGVAHQAAVKLGIKPEPARNLV